MRGMIKTKFTTNYFLHSNFLIIYSPSISTPMSYHMLMMKGIIITDLRTNLYFNPFYNQYIFSSILHHNYAIMYHSSSLQCHYSLCNISCHSIIIAVIFMYFHHPLSLLSSFCHHQMQSFTIIHHNYSPPSLITIIHFHHSPSFINIHLHHLPSSLIVITCHHSP